MHAREPLARPGSRLISAESASHNRNPAGRLFLCRVSYRDGLSRPIEDKSEQGHTGFVSQSLLSCTYDPGIAAGALPIGRPDIVKQSFDGIFISKELQPPPIVVKRLVLGQRNQLFSERLHELGLLDRSQDVLALVIREKQATSQVTPQREAMGCTAPESLIALTMPH